MGDREDSKRNNENSSEKMDTLSLSISTNRFSRDLLQRFMGAASEHGGAKEEEDEEIELNLGLSMGGRFGVDKSSNKLVRSSSVASCLPEIRDYNDAAAPPPAALVRTSSLPVETEEEWRKRKELQSLRRMEAKRRRSEKQRNLKSDSGGGGGGGLEEKKEVEVNLRARLEREKSLYALKRPGSSQLGLSTWASGGGGASQAVLRSGADVATAIGKGSGGGAQGSVESKGSSSSSVSDLEIKHAQGSSGELSLASIQSASNQDIGSSSMRARENPTKPGGPDMDSPSKRPEASRSRARDAGSNSIEDMPCVFTKGDGPNGRRVDGILYKYGKGEEVRIMCICHGTFHSPAEFVVHAGGTDVHNPLKHIVVNPNPSLL